MRSTICSRLVASRTAAVANAKSCSTEKRWAASIARFTAQAWAGRTLVPRSRRPLAPRRDCRCRLDGVLVTEADGGSAWGVGPEIRGQSGPTTFLGVERAPVIPAGGPRPFGHVRYPYLC